jgi:hypothetical protein
MLAERVLHRRVRLQPLSDAQPVVVHGGDGRHLVALACLLLDDARERDDLALVSPIESARARRSGVQTRGTSRPSRDDVSSGALSGNVYVAG